jgi:hypothetical protein
VPVPSDVFESAVVGAGFKLQQMPRAVTGAAASEDMFPPDCAEYCVTIVAVVVVNAGPAITGGSFFVLDFVQEIIPITRRIGKSSVPLIAGIKDTPRLGVVWCMLVDLGVMMVGCVLSIFHVVFYFLNG